MNYDGHFLWVPNQSGSSWWRPSRSGWKTASAQEAKGQPCLHGFSAFECHSYPMWIGSTDIEVIGSIARLELEQQGGIGEAEPETHLGFHKILESGPRSLVQICRIPGEFTENAPRGINWTDFQPAPALYSLPSQALVLYREQGRIVAIFSREGKLAHFHAFGKAPLSRDLMGELACLYSDLLGRGIIEAAQKVIVWNDVDPQAEAWDLEMLQFLGVPVEEEPMPAPDPTVSGFEGLIPQRVLMDREQESRRRKVVQMAGWGVMACVLLIGLLVFDYMRLLQGNRQLQAQVDVMMPTAERVQAARLRWEALAPSLEVSRYPVEIFHRVTSLLPSKGIRLVHFEIRDNQIVLRGEASNVPAANRFKAALEESFLLKDYIWTLPEPEIKGDRATFVAFGDYRFATPIGNES